jgi:mevalonate kinase
MPLSQGVRITAEPAEAGLRMRTLLDGRLREGRWPVEGGIERDGGPLRFVPAAAAALRARGIQVPPVLLWADADLAPGRGFSSSAAFCLAILDALSRHAGAPLDAPTLAELAFHVERDLLGIPCGRLDPLACVAGTPVLLRWDDQGHAEIRRVRPGQSLHFIVAAFPQARDTEGILAALNRHIHADLRAPAHPDAVAAVREAIATFASEAEAAVPALEAGDSYALGRCMDRAQAAYSRMADHVPALAAPGLARAVTALKGAGASGAKFSGAGGDGSVIALFPDPETAEAAHALLEREHGLSVWARTLEDE